MSPAELVYPIGVGLAEGGWVAVLYLLVDAVSRVPPPLAPVVFMVAATATCLAAGRLDRLGLPREAIVIGLLLGGALLGLLATAPARAALPTGAVADAFAVDPGGALLGIAALRGFIRAGSIRDPGQANRPFVLGVAGLAAAWIFAGALAEPMRSDFRSAAFVPTVAFLIGAMVTGAIARSRVAAGARVDPLANRSWLITLLFVVCALALAAPVLGVGLERAMNWIITWPLSLPVFIAALVIARLVVPSRGKALRRAGVFTFGPLLVLVGLSLLALLLPNRTPPPGSEPAGGGAPPALEPTTAVFDYLVVGLVVVAALAALALVARAWRRSERRGRPAGPGDLRETVSGRDPDEAPRGGLRARWRRLVGQRRPSDAVGAYLAALRALERWPDLRRAPDETPADHARRLRAGRDGSLELDLLAADFELARWGDRTISASEDRRAMGRFGRLRDRLAGRPRPDGFG